MADAPVAPPLDGTVPVLSGLVDFHAKHNPERPWATLAHEDGAGASPVSFAEYAQATHRIAHLFRLGRTGEDGEVVAILAHCDTLLYLALLPGLSRAGIVPLPLSPRLPAIAITGLLEKASCHRIISQPSFAGTLKAVEDELAGKGHPLCIESLPDVYSVFSGLPGHETLPKVQLYPESTAILGKDDLLLYLVSSGYTSIVPKLLPQRRETVLQWCKSSSLQEGRAKAISWGSFVPLPFHTMGVYMVLYAPLVSGYPVGIYAPRFPAIPPVPTPKNVLEAMKTTNSSGLPVSPAFLEAWAQSDDDIAYLATLKAVIFAGGLLSEKNGKKLVKAGVKLYAVYGGTEFGAHTLILDENDSKGAGSVVKTSNDWAWMRFPDTVNLRWVPQGDDTYELEFLRCEAHWPAFENLADTRGYATNDLWIKHPTKPGLWKIIGRKDDVICLSTGENVFAVPQENAVISSELVMGVVMFGEMRSFCGLLVELKPEFAIDPRDASSVTEMRNKLWPIVQEGNRNSTILARISKRIILFTDPTKPLPRAPKGTVIRRRSLELYSQEISDLYESIQASDAGPDFTPPASWSTEDVEAWLGQYAAANSQDLPQVDSTRNSFASLNVRLLRKHIATALERDPDARVQAVAKSFHEDSVLEHSDMRQLAAHVAVLVARARSGD